LTRQNTGHQYKHTVSRPYRALAQALQAYSPLARRAKRRPMVGLSTALAEQFARVVTGEHRVAAR
jgi:hypothetical protein